MKKKIYIHIGWHKTGTTSVQDFLLKNRKVLREVQRIYYPAEGMLICAHHTIAWAFQNKKTSPWGPIEIPGGGAEEFIDEIRAAADLNRCDTVIISSEEFCTFNNNEIKALYASLVKNKFEAVIVGYIRRQDQIIESAYNMEVKWWGSRLTQSFSEYIKSKNKLIKYTPVLQEWASIFGVTNMVIRPFSHEGLEGGDVRIDFCNAVSIDFANLDLRTERVNDSLATQTLEFLRILNNLAMPKDLNEKIVGRLFEYDKFKKLPKCVFFTPDERINFMSMLDQSNAGLIYFNDKIEFSLPSKEYLPEKNMRPLSLDEFKEIMHFALADQKLSGLELEIFTN